MHRKHASYRHLFKAHIRTYPKPVTAQCPPTGIEGGHKNSLFARSSLPHRQSGGRLFECPLPNRAFPLPRPIDAHGLISLIRRNDASVGQGCDISDKQRFSGRVFLNRGRNGCRDGSILSEEAGASDGQRQTPRQTTDDCRGFHDRFQVGGLGFEPNAREAARLECGAILRKFLLFPKRPAAAPAP